MGLNHLVKQVKAQQEVGKNRATNTANQKAAGKLAPAVNRLQ